MLSCLEHHFCLALEATLNWQSSECQTMNSQLVPGGHCSFTYASPVILTFSHKHVLYCENFLLHLFLFHWSYEWYKIEWVISVHTLHFFTIFSFFTLCNLSTASVLPLKPSLSYHICFVNSFPIWCCFPPLLPCNSLLILLLPFLCLSPCVPSLPSPCNFLTMHQSFSDLTYSQVLTVSL